MSFFPFQEILIKNGGLKEVEGVKGQAKTLITPKKKPG